MTAKGKPVEETGSKVPGYIVTFSDMVTLLLTFFVLLLSLADTQDEGLFEKGQKSFKRAIANFGMSGLLFSREMGSDFNHPKIKYKIDKGEDKPEDRSIDLAMEMFRRTLQEVEKTMKIQPSQITCTDKTFSITDIKFEPGKWTLDEAARAYLKSHINYLRESFTDETPMLYIVGLAAGEPGQARQWIVSARRAQAVADFIRTLLSEQENWPVYCWGAGPGGRWTDQGGLLTTETHIAIAALSNSR